MLRAANKKYEQFSKRDDRYAYSFSEISKKLSIAQKHLHNVTFIKSNLFSL